MKTLISLVSTFSIATVIGIASVNAANVELKYNADLSTETEKYVDDAIANIDIPEADVDLSDYYTKSEINTKFNTMQQQIDATRVDYATIEYVDSLFDGIATAEGGSY